MQTSSATIVQKAIVDSDYLRQRKMLKKQIAELEQAQAEALERGDKALARAIGWKIVSREERYRNVGAKLGTIGDTIRILQ